MNLLFYSLFGYSVKYHKYYIFYAMATFYTSTIYSLYQKLLDEKYELIFLLSILLCIIYVYRLCSSKVSFYYFIQL